MPTRPVENQDGEKRHGHLRTIGQHDRDPVTTANPHGPQRAAHLVEVLVEQAVGQRCAPRSENGQRVGIPLGVMFQQTRNGRNRNRGADLREFWLAFFCPRPVLPTVGRRSDVAKPVASRKREAQ
jgi:hypothetical protein